MVPSTVSSRPAAEAANPAKVRRHGGWLLSLSYAALLAAAIWTLDAAEPPVRPAAVLTTVLEIARTGFGLGADDRPGALTSRQAQPEGWPAWTDASATPPARQPR